MISTYFVVDGEPVPKGRPRFRVAGKFVQTYTPKETQDAEKKVLQEYMNQSGQSFGESPVRIKMVFWMGIPKSVSKRKREAMIKCEIPHTTKPDADNCAKLVMDALNGKAWKDDSQVVELTVEKKYSNMPCTEVWIKEWCY